jgi:hypothetical protein
MTLHAQNRQVPLEYTQTVEAHEEITVPAGKFMAFRIKNVDNFGNENLQWFIPELSVYGKQVLKRTAKHAQGAGYAVELISWRDQAHRVDRKEHAQAFLAVFAILATAALHKCTGEALAEIIARSQTTVITRRATSRSWRA